MVRVLTVDDDFSIRQVVKAILKRFGFTALVADNGPEALRLLQANDIDVLLTDIVMPGMSGCELIEEARKRHPNLPVCCMTADTRPVDVDLDSVPIISKPFSPRQLINAVRHVLEARQQRRDPVVAFSSGSLPTPEDETPRDTNTRRLNLGRRPQIQAVEADSSPSKPDTRSTAFQIFSGRNGLTMSGNP